MSPYVVLFLQVITPSTEHLFQTINVEQVNSWVAAMQETTEEALKHSNPIKKAPLPFSSSSSYGQNYVTHEPVPDAMLIILSIPGNDLCADCGSTYGTYNYVRRASHTTTHLLTSHPRQLAAI